jgi:hypothetical protein
MANIYGELTRAQLESLSADPTAGVTGRVFWHTVDLQFKSDSGTAVRAMLRNDLKCLIGTNATANNNIRFHRGAASVLQFLLGGDATAEGSLSTSLAQISAKMEGYAAASLPAAGNGGRVLYVSDETNLAYDDGAAIQRLVKRDSGTLNTPSIATPSITTAATHTQVATPANPSAGFNKFYFKSGNGMFWLDSGGVEHQASEVVNSDLRNFIINGNFDFWQRGTLLTLTTSATGYQPDRFLAAVEGSSLVVDFKQSVLVPTLAESGFQSTHSLQVDVMTAEAAIAAGEYCYVRYIVEGYDYGALKNRQVTLSFWVRSTKTGTHCVAFQNNGADRSYVAEYTVSVSNTWEKKSITVTLNPSGGTDNLTTGAGLRIFWTLAGGSTFQTTPGSWQTGNFFSTSSQVNAVDNATNNFRLSQIILNYGTTAQAFSRGGYHLAKELGLCQRYYELGDQLETHNSNTVSAINVRATWMFKAEKRVTPTCTTATGATENPTVWGVSIWGNTAANTTFNSNALTASAEF